FLRWMVRDATTNVDFGIWKGIPTSKLSCPLDVHSGNVARKLGLLKRKQNDAKALAELDKSLRKLDPLDPVKYDFALFGLGVFEKF
ncbi:MAG TPA: TIGR02757 family protein, partial [Maribacter sp.]|nr:TIGR02757 family protein [Maribacter sp.]